MKLKEKGTKKIKQRTTKPKKAKELTSLKRGRKTVWVKATPKPKLAVKAKPKPKLAPPLEIIKPAKIKPVEEKPAVVKIEAVKSQSVAPVIEEIAKKPKATPIKEKVVLKKPSLIVEKPKIITPPIELELKVLELDFPVTVKDLGIKLQKKPSVLIKKLMDKGLMIGINQSLKDETVIEFCKEFGFQVKKALDFEESALSMHKEQEPLHLLKPRPPVVTFMGHVDHGKTSLLDRIRKTSVAELEHGGITQHIGAYQVNLGIGPQTARERKITFLDTPGHEAFTQMRARGARITDIVVLVVAADDGVMPQTIEAIDHAREANAPIIVAINKIDKPQVNIDRVKKQLSEQGLTPEDWQGKTITVPVSAKTGEGIEGLLEMILLEAEMLELKANHNKLAKGIVIEAKLSKGKGPVATLLIQNGTLRINDNFIAGRFSGKVKAMFDDHGLQLKEAPPSMPVEALGLSGVPEAGEQFYVLEDENKAKAIAHSREEKAKQNQVRVVKRISLEELYTQIKEGKIKELKIILKADVMGSLEAIKDSLRKLEIEEIKINIIHEATGDINSSDVILAAASNALILGFNVNIDTPAKELVAKEEVEVRTYNVIYELNNDLKAALEGMLAPKIKKVFLGRAEVRKVFKLSSYGVVAGCFVSKGKILRSAEVSLVRNGQDIFEGKISSLKRFKDDVKEVAEGMECGISLGEFQDIQLGDVIEAYEIQKIARKL